MNDITYLYKVYRDGVYLGRLNVVSDFAYDQEINTSSTMMTIEVSDTIDQSDIEPDFITTEGGDYIQAEDGDFLVTERATDVIGSKDSGALIANYNEVEVIEVSPSNPNGKVVFRGYMSTWRTKLSEKTTTEIDVISDGDDLDDYIYGNVTETAQISQTSIYDYVTGVSTTRRHGQTFTPASSFSLVKVRLRMTAGSAITPTLSLKVYTGTPIAPGVLLGSATLQYGGSVYPNYEVCDFQFNEPISVESGSVYYFEIYSNSTLSGLTGMGVGYLPDDQYAGGRAYNYTSPSTGGSGWQASVDVIGDGSSEELYFVIYSGTIETDASFVNVDPADMVREAMDGYSSEGGRVTYSEDSVEDSGTFVEYYFRLQTTRDIIQKARELAPADYYWYVDPATTELTFKAPSETADHQFVLGRHIEELEIESTVEGIANVAYFTGGPTAGVNLLKKYTDTASLEDNRRGMVKLNDNRVTSANESAAETLSQSYFDEHSDERYRAQVTILASTYDISSIQLGQMVSFAGFNNMADSLLLQITNIRRRSDYVTLDLGPRPLRRERFIDELNRNLDKLATLDNPSTPS